MHDIGGMSKQNARETLSPKIAKPFALALSSQGKAPDWVMLIPPGRVDTNDGRSFLNDQPDVIVAKFTSGGLLLPFDFEHGSEIKAPGGDFTPAAGWIVDVENRDGAIWAKVDWTERGRAAIEAREVRYVSPAFHFDYSNGRIEALSSAALTVRPAISSLPAIAARQNPQEKENEMDRKALCQKLGLAETATDAEIQAAIGTLQQKANATASAQTPDLTKYVPRADYDAVVTDRDTLRTANASREKTDLQAKATALVEQGIKDAKIAPASKDFYLSMCSTKESLAQFEAFLNTAPKVVPGKVGEDTGADKTGKALTSAQKQVAAGMGMSDEEYAKSLDEQTAETKGA